MDERYDEVLATAIELLAELESRPMAQYERLSFVVFTILYLIDHLDKERSRRLVPSRN